jgi:hypothetical protein
MLTNPPFPMSVTLPRLPKGKIGSATLNVLIAAIETAINGAWPESVLLASVTGLQAALDLKAPLASPALTGTATAVNFTVTGLRKLAPSATPANITTAGAGTYTAANLAVGVITRDPNGAARTDTTDTAANLISTLALAADYQERECVLVNTADAAETITLAGGSGVTLKGTITVEQNCAICVSILRTSASTVCIRQK